MRKLGIVLFWASSLPIGLYIGHATSPATEWGLRVESFLVLTYAQSTAAWRCHAAGGEWNAQQGCCWMPRPSTPQPDHDDLDDEDGTPVARK